MYQSRFFLVTAGVFSLVTFIYAAFMHGTLLVASTSYSGFDERFAFTNGLMTPQLIATHVTICLVGPMLAVILIVHVFRNPKLSFGARIGWAFALVVGYGLIFYWYKHLVHPRLEKQTKHHSQRTN